MIPQTDCGNEQGGNELGNLAPAAYTPAYTEILDGGGENLKRVIRSWRLLPEHIRQTILTLVDSAAIANGSGVDDA